MTVISLAAEREARQPHCTGTAKCIACSHEWEAVAPAGLAEDLECPKCHLPRGMWKYNFGAAEGDALLICDCECDALTAYKRDAHLRVKCMRCGNDLTEAFFS